MPEAEKTSYSLAKDPIAATADSVVGKHSIMSIDITYWLGNQLKCLIQMCHNYFLVTEECDHNKMCE